MPSRPAATADKGPARQAKNTDLDAQKNAQPSVHQRLRADAAGENTDPQNPTLHLTRVGSESRLTVRWFGPGCSSGHPTGPCPWYSPRGSRGRAPLAGRASPRQARCMPRLSRLCTGAERRASRNDDHGRANRRRKHRQKVQQETRMISQAPQTIDYSAQVSPSCPGD